ncbi:MAG: ABC transporter permease [Bradyrhizobium sp.]|nr:ABC transporter permease [Bradyrhizobium sp.]
MLNPPLSRLKSNRRGASFRRHGLLAIGGFLVALVFIAALLAPVLAPYSPYDLDVPSMLQAPSAAHWLGTDELGRDVLSRTIYAAQISVQVALTAVCVGLVGGTLIGVVAAYFGELVDALLMRLMELLFSFPAILLAIILMASLGTSILNAMIAIGIIFIPGFARLARAATRDVLRQQYVEAARAIGMSDFRILAREILPNVAAPLLVEAAVAFAYAVLLESALSFLGLGAQPPYASWGNMLNTGRGFLAQAPWLGIVPGMALFMSVLGFNLVGDGLRDLLDPHLRD